ncbi:hypothetical protein [Candidatus Villigracilis saccharophilus]|uniref:hypothetical protein n=1 Tax=Candidatus Villigracilis saccharophilus TaxID=3140684 RepID=UPI0031366AFD|nr:hypothetical protein [Anaerolineales bacterium]
MTKTKILLYTLPLLVLACSMTAPQSGAAIPLPMSKQTNHANPPPAPTICQVRTGVGAGALNLRTCGGIHCLIATILHEGETLTQTQAQAVNGWLAVKTASGLQGWVNSKYINCKVTK